VLLTDATSQQSRQAAGLGETPRRRQENARSRGKAAVPGTPFFGAVKTEPSAHEPLISTETVAEVPLAGLSFGAGTTLENYVFPVSVMTQPSADMGSRWRQQQAGDAILLEKCETVVLHARGDRSRAV